MPIVLRSDQGLVPFFTSERDRRHLCCEPTVESAGRATGR